MALESPGEILLMILIPVFFFSVITHLNPIVPQQVICKDENVEKKETNNSRKLFGNPKELFTT